MICYFIHKKRFSVLRLTSGLRMNCSFNTLETRHYSNISSKTNTTNRFYPISYHVIMVRKGVSLQEKRERILRIYHESKEVFNLKEIEKLGSKAGVGTSLHVDFAVDISLI